MQAPENIEIVEATETPVRGACLSAGCECKDPRIVSGRRAAFFADMARRSGQTADRFVPVESSWRIALVQPTDLEPQLLSEAPEDLDLVVEEVHTPASV